MARLTGRILMPAAILVAALLSRGCQCCDHIDVFDNFTLTEVRFTQDVSFVGISGYSRYHSVESCEMRYANTTVALETATGRLIVEHKRRKKIKAPELPELEDSVLEFAGLLEAECRNCRLSVGPVGEQTEVLVTTGVDRAAECDSIGSSGMCVQVYQEGRLIESMLLDFSVRDESGTY